jgi:hypothetical protein
MYNHNTQRLLLQLQLHFGSFEARVPAAVSVVWMAITGSLMAIVWRYVPVKAPKFDRSVKTRFEKVTLTHSLHTRNSLHYCCCSVQVFAFVTLSKGKQHADCVYRRSAFDSAFCGVH